MGGWACSFMKSSGFAASTPLVFRANTDGTVLTGLGLMGPHHAELRLNLRRRVAGTRR